ncbi:MAG: conserved exported protein of unknown function [Promethearchaeota archaeon]|nr:MAG: conserved exported protein of unknown function [Candidatus Lokiarchaeota archaeon]
MPRRKRKLKYSRKYACKHLQPKGDISSSRQALCYCPARNLVLGTKAYVCQVCYLYSKTSTKTADVYQESKLEADKLLEQEEMEEIEIEELEEEEEIDLSVDEFDEEEIILERYEQKRAGKSIEESEEFAEMECPFCGELFDNLAVHIRDCDFAPEDVDVEDYLPARKVKKAGKEEEDTETKKDTDKLPCPYCGKKYSRLGRHLPYCDDRPEDADEELEEKYKDGKADLSDFKE